jgi:hypothetical protein
MGRNPKGSRWESASNANRGRKNVKLTLPPDVIAKLDELARVYGSKSAAVEALVRAAV